MGFFSRLFRPLEQKQSVYERFLELLESGARTRSGVAVNWEKALQVSTVLCCARVLAEGCSQVPLKVFQASADGRSRLPAKEHPLYNVLHLQASEFQTSFEWRETSVIHAALCGNALAYMNRHRGAVAELLPFEPQNACVKRSVTGALTYEVRAGGETKIFSASDILHIRGPSWNGYAGLDAVRLARESIGLALATEETHAQFHQNGAKPSGLLTVDGVLDPKQYEQMRAWIARSIGSANAGVPLIVDRGAKWEAQSMSGVDAQHLETRLHQVREICAFMRVSPLMVGYSDKAATYASAEQMFLAHVVHTLAPWYERIEQRINVSVLTERDRQQGLYAKFVEEGLLRGALKDTAEYLVKLSTNGILTRNEARAKLDENPLPGLDEPLTPANLDGGKATDEHVEATAKAVGNLGETMRAAVARMDASAAALPPSITINQGAIHVATPDVKVANHLPEPAPPTVAVQVDAHLPEQKAPDVHAHFEATLPEVKAPDVKVAVTNNVPAAEVNVHLPARRIESDVKRDRDGNLVHVTQIETDLVGEGNAQKHRNLQ